MTHANYKVKGLHEGGELQIGAKKNYNRNRAALFQILSFGLSQFFFFSIYTGLETLIEYPNNLLHIRIHHHIRHNNPGRVTASLRIRLQTSLSLAIVHQFWIFNFFTSS